MIHPREAWAAFLVVVGGSLVGALLGWLQWDGLDIDL